MNFLAHCFLSCDDHELLVGNLIADMIRNKDLDKLSPGVLQGVMLHRSIDRYTDNHNIPRQSARRLHERQGKYAPVIVDIFYDHLLYQNWESYTELGFSSFSNTVYDYIESFEGGIPEKVHTRLRRMVDGNWLASYTTLEGLEYVFSRVARRTRFESNMSEAAQDLQENYKRFEEDFNAFFPDLQMHVKMFCGC